MWLCRILRRVCYSTGWSSCSLLPNYEVESSGQGVCLGLTGSSSIISILATNRGTIIINVNLYTQYACQLIAKIIVESKYFYQISLPAGY